jgi:cell division protease FtsH
MNNNTTRAFITFVFILLAAFAFFSFWNIDQNPPEETSLNNVVSQINEDKVSSIEIQNNELIVSIKDSDKKLKTKKETDASLTETLTNLNVSPEKLNALEITIKEETGFAFWAATLAPILLPMIIIVGVIYYMAKSIQKGNNRAMTFGNTTAKKVDPNKGNKKATFKDIAGNKEAKEELTELVDFLKSPQKFKDLGAEIPKGALLVGPPGTGKTLMARAIAGEANVPFFHIAGSEFVEMFVGVGASRVRDLFSKAKKSSPSILFIDEIDAVGRQRGAGLGGSHDEREQTLNQILSEMDGFEQDTNVIVIAATNRPDVLDPALLRPGRFDRQVTIGLPDIKDRAKILEIHSKNKPLEKNINLQRVAERTPGFSGADLKNLMNEAAILAARENKKEISQQHCYDSIEKVILGPERKSFIMSKKEKKITAYHEAGHALVAHIQPETDPVQKISIISRGRAAGYTLQTPDRERHFRTRKDFLAELSVLFGGYVAEKLIFSEITTGASSDLKKATQLARRMITEYGMSTELGPVTYGEKDEMVFLGKEIGEQRNYSEETAASIDKEIQKIAKNAFAHAEKILTENKDKLEQLTQELIKKETIEREEFEKMFGKKNEKQESKS